MEKETKQELKELIPLLAKLVYHVVFLLGLMFALFFLIKNFF